MENANHMVGPTKVESNRAGFVALVGKPNVGKSTLMNSLLEQRLSIVTSKPQTTRQRVLGILTKNKCSRIISLTKNLSG